MILVTARILFLSKRSIRVHMYFKVYVGLIPMNGGTLMRLHMPLPLLRIT